MAILTLTESAEQKIKELCSKNNKYAVKLGIKGGGCCLLYTSPSPRD